MPFLALEGRIQISIKHAVQQYLSRLTGYFVLDAVKCRPKTFDAIS